MSFNTEMQPESLSRKEEAVDLFNTEMLPSSLGLRVHVCLQSRSQNKATTDF